MNFSWATAGFVTALATTGILGAVPTTQTSASSVVVLASGPTRTIGSGEKRRLHVELVLGGSPTVEIHSGSDIEEVVRNSSMRPLIFVGPPLAIVEVVREDEQLRVVNEEQVHCPDVADALRSEAAAKGDADRFAELSRGQEVLSAAALGEQPTVSLTLLTRVRLAAYSEWPAEDRASAAKGILAVFARGDLPKHIRWAAFDIAADLPLADPILNRKRGDRLVTEGLRVAEASASKMPDLASHVVYRLQPYVRNMTNGDKTIAERYARLHDLLLHAEDVAGTEDVLNGLTFKPFSRK